MLDYIFQGGEFTYEFIRYHLRLITTHDAGHKGFLLFHPVVLLLGVFPASIVALGALSEFRSSTAVNMRRLWDILMLSWMIVVVVTFTIVQTKIIHYSSMTYYPITWFAAIAINRWNTSKARSIPNWVGMVLLTLATIYGLLLVLAPVLMNIKHQWIDYIHDPFAHEALKAPVDWPISLVFIGLIMIVGYFVLFFSYRSKPGQWVIYNSVLNGFIAYLILFWYAPRVERHVQGPIIDVYEALPADRTVVIPLNFKTYAPYFYLGGTGVVPPDEFRDTLYILRVYKQKSWSVPDSIWRYYTYAYGFYYRLDTLKEEYGSYKRVVTQ